MSAPLADVAEATSRPPASAARVAANRRNAQLSTGPRTAEGKARSRRNALKHGLTTHGGVIDPDYRGSVKVITFNMSARPHHIIPGMRVAQIIFEKAITLKIDQVDQLDQTE